MKSGVVTVIDNTRRLTEAIGVLTGSRVMVGVPQEKDSRRESGALGNAEIGYLMENGIPDRNVPPRPHMIPGIKRVQSRIVDLMKQAGRLALEAKPEAVYRALSAVGLTAQSSIRGIIRAGIPPPLADSTIRARARAGRKGAALELASRAAGNPAGTSLVKPLINTGQYLAAITYVIRTIRGNG